MAELETHILEPWNDVAYEAALETQARLSREGRTGWLVFCCAPTITLGRRADSRDVLVPSAELASGGVRVLPVSRGGQVTYHGPGQAIGFPFGTLERHVGDSRKVRMFVATLKATLERFIAAELGRAGDARRVVPTAGDDCAGVWVERAGRERRKIVSLGLSFSREAISHGFALNLEPLEKEFARINPCGEAGAVPASLFGRPLAETERRDVVSRLVDILSASRR